MPPAAGESSRSDARISDLCSIRAVRHVDHSVGGLLWPNLLGDVGRLASKHANTTALELRYSGLHWFVQWCGAQEPRLGRECAGSAGWFGCCSGSRTRRFGWCLVWSSFGCVATQPRILSCWCCVTSRGTAPADRSSAAGAAGPARVGGVVASAASPAAALGPWGRNRSGQTALTGPRMTRSSCAGPDGEGGWSSPPGTARFVVSVGALRLVRVDQVLPEGNQFAARQIYTRTSNVCSVAWGLVKDNLGWLASGSFAAAQFARVVAGAGSAS